MNFDQVWSSLPIPAEFDDMDSTDQDQWRGIVRLAYKAGMEQQKKEQALDVMADNARELGLDY